VTAARASIVIPLLDQRDDWLERAVRSALTQTVACEVVVVRSARTRPSNLMLLADLASAGGLVVVERPPGAGFVRAINVGIRTVRTPRLGLLFSDDWLEPDAVERCLAHDADIVASSKTAYLEDGVTRLASISPIMTRARYERLTSLARKAEHLTHFLLFRTATLIAVGGLDESLGDFPGIDDFDLIWTLLERDASVAIVEASLYNYRDHSGDRLTLRDPVAARQTLERILAKHGSVGDEREQLLARHSRWFGRPVHVVVAESARPRSS
jgi:glycosyltransferase involved in cell wall biosynthesis